jgi:uncharacterized protein YihD (DUF1040 family)
MAELNSSVEQNTKDISLLQQRADGHDKHLARLDSEIAGLHARFDSVATKEDIGHLQKDFNSKYGESFRLAINAVPPWAFAIFTLALVVLAGIALYARH